MTGPLLAVLRRVGVLYPYPRSGPLDATHATETKSGQITDDVAAGRHEVTNKDGEIDLAEFKVIMRAGHPVGAIDNFLNMCMHPRVGDRKSTDV